MLKAESEGGVCVRKDEKYDTYKIDIKLKHSVLDTIISEWLTHDVHPTS